jgi:hypothetical protein
LATHAWAKENAHGQFVIRSIRKDEPLASIGPNVYLPSPCHRPAAQISYCGPATVRVRQQRTGGFDPVNRELNTLAFVASKLPNRGMFQWGQYSILQFARDAVRIIGSSVPTRRLAEGVDTSPEQTEKL